LAYSQQISVIGLYDEYFPYKGLENYSNYGPYICNIYVNKHRTTVFQKSLVSPLPYYKS